MYSGNLSSLYYFARYISGFSYVYMYGGGGGGGGGVWLGICLNTSTILSKSLSLLRLCSVGRLSIM